MTTLRKSLEEMVMPDMSKLNKHSREMAMALYAPVIDQLEALFKKRTLKIIGEDEVITGASSNSLNLDKLRRNSLRFQQRELLKGTDER